MADAILVGGGGGGVHSDDVTAAKAQVLAGYNTVTTDSNDEVVSGTMVNRGTVNHSLPANGSFTIPQGYHSGSGVVSQSLTTKGAATYYPTTSDQTIESGRYLSGTQTIKAVSQENLIASNIKKGVTVYVKNGNGNIYAVTGTWEGYVPTSTIPYNHGAFANGYSIAGQKSYTGTGTSSCTITYQATNIRLTRGEVFQSQWSGNLYFAARTLSGINTINMSYITDGSGFSSSNYYAYVAVFPTLPTQFNADLASAIGKSTSSSSSSETTVSVNVSALTNTQYIFFGICRVPTSGAGAATYFDITKIWYT